MTLFLKQIEYLKFVDIGNLNVKKKKNYRDFSRLYPFLFDYQIFFYMVLFRSVRQDLTSDTHH